jgi:virulence factor
MDSLINRFKWIRKKNIIRKSYSSTYAFVGIGNHSLHHLYPVLAYLNVPLKYIVTKSGKTAGLIRENYHSVIATNDFDTVLNDPDIRGIFICSDPLSHFQLTQKALSHNKHVFVEKPVCMSSSELHQLIETAATTKTYCVVGMQKRFSNCTRLLKSRLKLNKVISYNYRFGVGAYPEGNMVMDLFIHPLDLIVFLFGKAEIISLVDTKNSNGIYSVLLQLKHENIIGSVEVSTAYSWAQPFEELVVNTQTGVYEMTNHQLLEFSPKPLAILSIPLEKIIRHTVEKQILYDGNSFLPVAKNNFLVSQGYFEEINTFINLCENKTNNNPSSLESLGDTYRLLMFYFNKNDGNKNIV